MGMGPGRKSKSEKVQNQKAFGQILHIWAQRHGLVCWAKVFVQLQDHKAILVGLVLEILVGFSCLFCIKHVEARVFYVILSRYSF